MTRLPHGPRTALACLLVLAACGDDAAGTTPASTGTDPGATTSSTDPGATTPGTSPTGTTPTGTDSGATAPDTDSGATTPGTSPTGSATDVPTTSTSTSTATTDDLTATAASTEPGTGTGPDTGDSTTGGATGLVRFVAFGDTGEGNESQYAVAQAMVTLCAEKGCDFGLLLGDNFYDSGVDGVDDPQWQEKFELPYEDISFPIYATLGNHDYGGNGIGVDFDTKKSQYQVDYTKKSQIWKLPAKYHSFKHAHAEFWDLDTNQIMTDPINGKADKQADWLDAGVAASLADWKIAFGHHPYVSNGEHGNAGSYENLEGIPLPFVTGKSVKEFFDDSVCGKIDVYICGHDHNLQWLEPKCGTEFIVSGAGSKSEGLPGKNPAFFGMPETEGFLWVEIEDNTFTGVFYDQTGKELFTRTFNKP